MRERKTKNMKTISTLIRNSGIFHSDSSSGTYSCEIKSENLSKDSSESVDIIFNDEQNGSSKHSPMMDEFEELSWSDLAVDMSLVSDFNPIFRYLINHLNYNS